MGTAKKNDSEPKRETKVTREAKSGKFVTQTKGSRAAATHVESKSSGSNSKSATASAQGSASTPQSRSNLKIAIGAAFGMWRDRKANDLVENEVRQDFNDRLGEAGSGS